MSVATEQAVTHWWSPNGVQHVIVRGHCATCGKAHPTYVTTGHPVLTGAGYDCACGECDAVRNGAHPCTCLCEQCQGSEDAGYVSARGGKWHRATHPEPTFMRDETTACGMTFRPLNVTWNGDFPPTTAAHLCRRRGCASS